MVVVLGSFEGQVERGAGSGVTSLPAGVVIDTSLVVDIYIDSLIWMAVGDHWQSQ